MRPRGFTLVELLVVIAVVAVLLALLLPAFAAVRSAARSGACLSNIRSIQQSAIAYATDQGGMLPDVGLPHGGLGFVEQSWITTLRPYCDNGLVLRSPLDDSPHWPLELEGQGVPVPNSGGAFRQSSYGMNNYLSRTFSPAAAIDPAAAADRLSRVAAPAGTVMFLLMAEEGEFAGSDHPHVEEWWLGPGQANLPPVQAASQVSTGAAGGPAASWDARANWSFLDGHVATLPFNEVYLDNLRNRFDPAVAKVFDLRTGGN